MPEAGLERYQPSSKAMALTAPPRCSSSQPYLLSRLELGFCHRWTYNPSGPFNPRLRPPRCIVCLLVLEDPREAFLSVLPISTSLVSFGPEGDVEGAIPRYTVVETEAQRG